MNKDRMIDRIGDYLIPHTNDYIFDELSESCLERAGLADILTGVPGRQIGRASCRERV